MPCPQVSPRLNKTNTYTLRSLYISCLLSLLWFTYLFCSLVDLYRTFHYYNLGPNCATQYTYCQVMYSCRGPRLNFRTQLNLLRLLTSIQDSISLTKIVDLYRNIPVSLYRSLELQLSCMDKEISRY